MLQAHNSLPPFLSWEKMGRVCLQHWLLGILNFYCFFQYFVSTDCDESRMGIGQWTESQVDHQKIICIKNIRKGAGVSWKMAEGRLSECYYSFSQGLFLNTLPDYCCKSISGKVSFFPKNHEFFIKYLNFFQNKVYFSVFRLSFFKTLSYFWNFELFWFIFSLSFFGGCSKKNPALVLSYGSVKRKVRKPKLFSGELSRKFGSNSVQNVGWTPAHHISNLQGVCRSFESSWYNGLRLGSNFVPSSYLSL